MSESSTIPVSASRTLLLPATVLDPATILRWPTKSPASVCAFTLDVGPWISDIGDFVSSFTVTINSGNAAGLTVQGQQITDASQSGSGLTVVLAGGVTGNEYSITFTATSAGGAVESWTVWLYVQNIGATLARQQPTTIGPAGQGYNDRGAWQPNTNYNPYDVLTHGASVYECPMAFTSGSVFDATPLNLWLTTGEDISSLGEQITALAAAVAAADSDLLPVGQSGSPNLVAQNFLAIWTYIRAKQLSTPVAPIEITEDTQLTFTAHYGRTLICSQPVTLTTGLFSTIGNGFWCYIINLSTGLVTMSNGITSGGASPTITPGAAAQLSGLSYSGGNVVFFPGAAFTLATSGITVTNPGTHAASTTFTVAGTYTGGTALTALDWSINSGSTWTAASSPTIGSGAFSFAITGGVAGGEYQMLVRDHNNTGTVGASTTFIIGTNTLSISGGSTGSPTVALSITGTVVPASDAVEVYLDTQNSVAPSAGWTAATNTSGAITASLTPSTSGTYYVWAKDTVSGLTVVSSAITVSTTGSITMTAPVSTGYVGFPLELSGTVSPSATAVRVGLSTTNTVAPTSWTNATVSSGNWTAALAPAAAGTYYVWAEQTSTPSIQAISSGTTVVSAVPTDAVVAATYGNGTWTINDPMLSTQTHGYIDAAGNFSRSIAFGGGATVSMYWSQTAPTSEPTADGSTVIAVAGMTNAVGPLFNSGNVAVYIPTPNTAGTWFLSLWIDGDSPNNGGVVFTPFNIT
jgi:hypothetical protein